MTEDQPGRVLHGLSVAVATSTGAVLGFSAVALVAVLVYAALDATIGVEPPDVAEVPDTAGEWALAVGARCSGWWPARSSAAGTPSRGARPTSGEGRSACPAMLRGAARPPDPVRPSTRESS